MRLRMSFVATPELTANEPALRIDRPGRVDILLAETADMHAIAAALTDHMADFDVWVQRPDGLHIPAPGRPAHQI